jgi:hypothetical protein
LVGVPATLEIWKFELDDLRKANYWTTFKSGTAQMLPVVVLTNRKAEIVRDWPFRLAYDIFEDRLTKSDRWLIAGCSFGDEPVNVALQSAREERKRRRLTDPRLLVVGRGGDPIVLRNRAVKISGLNASQVMVDTWGLPATKRPA